MGQIIDLLSNLFKLTKVASVTLPGLAAAGALALMFWMQSAHRSKVGLRSYE